MNNSQFLSNKYNSPIVSILTMHKYSKHNLNLMMLKMEAMYFVICLLVFVRVSLCCSCTYFLVVILLGLLVDCVGLAKIVGLFGVIGSITGGFGVLIDVFVNDAAFFYYYHLSVQLTKTILLQTNIYNNILLYMIYHYHHHKHKKNSRSPSSSSSSSSLT